MTHPMSPARVEGPNLVLRLIRPDDAAYLHGLRSNEVYNRYLSKIGGTVEDQRRWIEAYKLREAEGRELYYVVERKDGVRCGVVRIYNIGQDEFNWGSWILDSNKPPKAALESAVLSLGVGFDMLCRERALVEARVHNVHASAFYCRLGMSETHRTNRDIYFVYPKARYESDRDQFSRVLGEAGLGGHRHHDSR